MSGRPAWRHHDAAVSELVGNILLVGITVVIGVIVAVIILSRPPPLDATHPNLSIGVSPGTDGLWSTGNEVITISHRGGEALPRDITVVRMFTTSTSYTFQGAGLQDAFTDGSLKIGETWSSTAQALTIADGDVLDVNIVLHRTTGSVVVGTASVTAGG